MELTFQHLAEALPQIVWTAGSDGVIDYISPQWQTFSGLPQDSPDFLNWIERVHPDDVDETISLWNHSVKSGEIYERILRLRGANGKFRWFAARAKPIFGQDQGIIKWYGTSTDIDEQKRNQNALQEHARDRDRFIAMLGHELRNPLAAINASYEILDSEKANQEQRAQAFQILGNQLSHLTRLVDDTLDVSRLTSGKLRLITCPLEVGQLVRDCCEALEQEAIDKGLSLNPPEESDEQLWINGDDVRLSQCLTNILTNALKFTDPGGSINVSIETGQGEVFIKVADDGIGMRPEDASKLFTPFVQGSDAPRMSTEGLGLGLAVVKKLITLHGGRINVDSPGPGKGTTFTLVLPQTEAPEGIDEELSSYDLPSSIEILVIEDNESVAEALQLLLELEGHQVRLAGDGESALTSLESATPDMIISDLTLPGHLTGWDLAEKISASYPEDKRPYLIALSGHAQPHHVERCKEAGFDEHLAKPPSTVSLREALARGIFHLRNISKT